MFRFRSEFSTEHKRDSARLGKNKRSGNGCRHTCWAGTGFTSSNVGDIELVGVLDLLRGMATYQNLNKIEQFVVLYTIRCTVQLVHTLCTSISGSILLGERDGDNRTFRLRLNTFH